MPTDRHRRQVRCGRRNAGSQQQCLRRKVARRVVCRWAKGPRKGKQQMLLRMNPNGVEYNRGPRRCHGIGDRLGRYDGVLKMPVRVAVVVMVVGIRRVVGCGRTVVVPVETPAGCRSGITERARMVHHLVCGDPQEASQNREPEQSHGRCIQELPRPVNKNLCSPPAGV
jgi:hypothetical protein